MRALRARGIKKFATYETNYNCCFVRNIPPHEKFEITSLKSLRELTQGYAVIPGTSHKALTMESDWEGIGEGDYTKDPALNDLLNTGKIASIADECFFTMGSSRIWVHESEITSYRDMILHEISDKDRFRALGWLIDARKLLPALNQDRNYSVIPRCEGNADF